MPSRGSRIVASSITSWTAPFGAAPSARPALSSLASRTTMPPWASRRAAVAALAPFSSIGTLAPAGTFISARTARMAVTSRITQPISSAAAGSAGRCE